ncbi:MAG: pyridoxal-phosphate dependent enzyme, partial [Planctomycetota bacterium]
MTDIRESVLETVGRTPLIRLSRIFRKSGVDLLAKHEGFNPAGSVKERIAVAMIEGAERDGLLHVQQTLQTQPSSQDQRGSADVGLAAVGDFGDAGDQPTDVTVA